MVDEAPQAEKAKINLVWPLSLFEPLIVPAIERMKQWDDTKIILAAILVVIIWLGPIATTKISTMIQAGYEKFAVQMQHVAEVFDKQQERSQAEHKAEQDRTYKMIEKMQDRQFEMMYGTSPVPPKERPK